MTPQQDERAELIRKLREAAKTVPCFDVHLFEEAAALLADGKAGGEAYQGPKKFTPEEITAGNVGIRWVTENAVFGRPTEHDLREYLQMHGKAMECSCEKCVAFYRPQQAAQVPPFPNRILELLREVSDRKGTKTHGPWEDENGEPLQDDADAALEWLAAHGIGKD